MSLVRDSIANVSDNLNYVTIHDHRIQDLATKLADETFDLPAWRLPIFLNEDKSDTTPDEVIDFVLVGNTINFQHRDYDTGDKFRTTYNGKTWSGSFAMWACLKRAYDAGEPIHQGVYLASLSQSDVEEIFSSSLGPPLPLLDVRHSILTAIGDRLVNSYDGRFANFVSETANSLYADGEGFLERIIREFTSYRDSVSIESDGDIITVYFLKRAQLAAAVLYGRFQHSSRFLLEDPEAFTVFPDYNIPNILRHYGILSYSPELACSIDRSLPINAGDRKEVEIRIATVRAADRLLDQISRMRGEQILAPQLDTILFQYRDRVNTTPHRVRTFAY